MIARPISVSSQSTSAIKRPIASNARSGLADFATQPTTGETLAQARTRLDSVRSSEDQQSMAHLQHEVVDIVDGPEIIDSAERRLFLPSLIPVVLGLLNPRPERVESLLALPSTDIANGITYTNAQFTDGTRGALLQVDETMIYIEEVANQTERYYLIDTDGKVGEELQPGSATIADGLVSVSEDGNLDFRGIQPSSTQFSTLSYNAVSNEIQATTYSSREPGEATTSETFTANVWQGAELVAAGRPGAVLTTDELYNYYSSTPEGRAILAREPASFTSSTSIGRQQVLKELFIARVQYNREEGQGVDLFAQFMPDRAQLSGSELAIYDAQLERALAHVAGDSRVLDDNLPVDPSLQFIMASGLTEAVGVNESLMAAVLSDIDNGWFISMDGSHIDGSGGRYSTRQEFFWGHHRAKITYNLNSLLGSYADPNDRYDLVSHEMAHSLDYHAASGKGDGIPWRMNAQDKQMLVEVRTQFFDDYQASLAVTPSSPDTNGLGTYAYTNSKEFWAEISEFYLSGPSGERALFNSSPELHGILERYYGS